MAFDLEVRTDALRVLSRRCSATSDDVRGLAAQTALEEAAASLGGHPAAAVLSSAARRAEQRRDELAVACQALADAARGTADGYEHVEDLVEETLGRVAGLLTW